MNNPYIFDIAFGLLILFMIYLGRSKGAFRVIAGLFGTLAAFIGAKALSPAVTPFVSGIMAPFAESSVSSAAESLGLSDLMGLSASEWAAESSVMESLSAIAEKAGISLGFDSLSQAADPSATAGSLLTDAFLEKTAPLLTFILLFFLIKLAINIVCRLISLDLPIIGSLNHMAGGLLGLLGGAVLVMALCAGIYAFGSAEETGLTSYILLSKSFTGRLLWPIIHY